MGTTKGATTSTRPCRGISPTSPSGSGSAGDAANGKASFSRTSTRLSGGCSLERPTTPRAPGRYAARHGEMDAVARGGAARE